MKKVFILLGIFCISSAVSKGQGKLTFEQARSICAQQMALFTTSVSTSYQKGNSYEQFKFSLCGKSQLTMEGSNQLKVAYNFLVQGVTADVIIRTYQGKEIASSLNYLANAHKRGIESDGAELFGGVSGTPNSAFAKSSGGGCRWYQFLCLLLQAAGWLVMNWPGVSEIVALLNGPVFGP